MKTLFILLLCLFCISIAGFAQDPDRGKQKHLITAKLGLTSNEEVVLEPLYTFMFYKYIGVSAGITLLGEVMPGTVWSVPSPWGQNPKWYVSDSHEKTAHLFLRTALKFRFPVLRQQKENLLFLNIEPGLFMNPIRHRQLDVVYDAYKLDFFNPNRSVSIDVYDKHRFYYDLGASLTMNVDRFEIGLGYAISNYDMYDYLREAQVEHIPMSELVRKRRFTHFIEASITLKL